MPWNIKIQIMDETAEDRTLLPGEEVIVQVPESARLDYGYQALRPESIYFGVYMGEDEFGNCIVSDLHTLTTKISAPEFVTPMTGKQEN